MSGITPWKRQLELCDRWLEIIQDELALRGEDLNLTERAELSSLARAIAERAHLILDAVNPDDCV